MTSRVIQQKLDHVAHCIAHRKPEGVIHACQRATGNRRRAASEACFRFRMAFPWALPRTSLLKFHFIVAMAMKNEAILAFLAECEMGAKVRLVTASREHPEATRANVGTLYFAKDDFFVRLEGEGIIKVLDPSIWVFSIDEVFRRRSASRARLVEEAVAHHAKRDQLAQAASAKRDRPRLDAAAPDYGEARADATVDDRAAIQAQLLDAQNEAAMAAAVAEKAETKRRAAEERVAAARRNLQVRCVPQPPPPPTWLATPSQSLLLDIDERVAMAVDKALERFNTAMQNFSAAPQATMPQLQAPAAPPRGQDDVDRILEMSRMNAALLRGEEGSPRQQLCTGLSVPMSLGQPWVVFSGVHYASDAVRNPSITGIAGWKLDLSGARTNAELLIGNAGTGFAVEAAAIKLRLHEEAFENILLRFMSVPPRDKQDYFAVFFAGAMLMEAWASAKLGWPAGGARVVKDFSTAWDAGYVDFAKLWPRSTFRQTVRR